MYHCAQFLPTADAGGHFLECAVFRLTLPETAAPVNGLPPRSGMHDGHIMPQASIELDEMKRKAAEEAEQTASETTEPNATATSPVTAAEQNPDAQNMSEFSPAEAAGSRGYEGGGQDAESATARFATPSGARGTDFWASNSEQSSQPGTSAGTSAGEAGPSAYGNPI